MAEQPHKKTTMFVRVNQFLGDGVGALFTTHSRQLKLKGQSNGQIYPGREEAFYLSKLSDLDHEVFSLGLVIRSNEKPMHLVTERLLAHQEYDSHEPD
jgi:hypothetical protein